MCCWRGMLSHMLMWLGLSHMAFDTWSCHYLVTIVWLRVGSTCAELSDIYRMSLNIIFFKTLNNRYIFSIYIGFSTILLLQFQSLSSCSHNSFPDARTLFTWLLQSSASYYLVIAIILGKSYWSHFLAIHTTYDCIVIEKKIIEVLLRENWTIWSSHLLVGYSILQNEYAESGTQGFKIKILS
jgi:hypothetical protein